MALNFDELKTILDETGLKFLCDPEKEAIVLGFSGFNGVYNLLLKVVENGEGLLFRVPGLAMLRNDHPFKARVMETLLSENHRVKIGRFCYDPSDGEIYLDWFLPIEDGTLTPQQLKRCITALSHLSDEITPRLRHILETGEDLPPEEIGVKGALYRLLREGLQRGLLSEEDEINIRRLLSDYYDNEAR